MVWYFILFFNLIFALSKQKKLQAEIKAEDKKRRKIEDRAEVMAKRSEHYIAAKSAELRLRVRSGARLTVRLRIGPVTRLRVRPGARLRVRLRMTFGLVLEPPFAKRLNFF